jgi:hypothetical protein
LHHQQQRHDHLTVAVGHPVPVSRLTALQNSSAVLRQVQEFIQVLEITGHLLDRWGDDADPLGVLPLPPTPPETGGKGSAGPVRFKAFEPLPRHRVVAGTATDADH